VSCIFCEISAGRIPARIAFEDDLVLAFHDIAPQAPTHILIIPRRHIANVLDLKSDDAPLVGHMMRAAIDLARAQGLAERGFRLVFNSGPDAGYSVFHIHLHLLGGRAMGWPPG
jgi:histidine triad (HIT) family protein